MVMASTVMRASTVVAAVTPSGAPLCALLAIGCCERQAVRAEEEVQEVAWTVAVLVVVASMAAVAQRRRRNEGGSVDGGGGEFNE